jgi:hypothetical protein
LSLGVTTVSCSVTDGGGKTAQGTFQVTVADTTAPVIATIADYEISTSDPAGAAVDYGFGAVVELVDPHPTLVCTPATGTTFPVGTTTVSCVATDASGNSSTMSFRVTVRYVANTTWTAIWGEPVGRDGATLVANAGRTIPMKVELFANGVRQTSGPATLVVTTCAGASVTTVPLDGDGGRWSGHLDTGLLGRTGCFVATATLRGNSAGTFRIDLRGGTTATATATKTLVTKRAKAPATAQAKAPAAAPSRMPAGASVKEKLKG